MRFTSTMGFLVVLPWLAACGGDDAPATDAGRDATVARDGSTGSDGGGSDGGTNSDGGTTVDGGTGVDGGGATDGGGMSDGGAGLDGGGAPDAALPTDCIIDTDCPSGYFCRDRMAGGRECHAYAREGDSCGGFRPSWSIERCDPSLSCVERSPLIADAPGNCAIAVTVADLLAEPARYDGHVVAVIDGWVGLGPTACTRIACPPSMPCCNTCNSMELLRDSMAAASGVPMREPSGADYGCMGNECVPTDMCTIEPNRGYRVIGTFHAAEGGYIVVLSALPTS